MVDWIKKLFGYFGAERINVKALGQEWQRIVREQAKELKFLRRKAMQLEEKIAEQQDEINALKVELFNLKLKDRIDEQSE